MNGVSLTNENGYNNNHGFNNNHNGFNHNLNGFGQAALNAFNQESIQVAKNFFTQPIQNGFQNPVQNGFQNPVQNGFQNPVQNGFQNPVQNGFCSEPITIKGSPVQNGCLNPKSDKPFNLAMSPSDAIGFSPVKKQLASSPMHDDIDVGYDYCGIPQFPADETKPPIQVQNTGEMQSPQKEPEAPFRCPISFLGHMV